MTTDYVELHAKSFYSFGAGASHTHELLAQAKEHGYDALALTDTNLCGALEFARLAGSLGVQPVTGGEITLLDGSRIVLLARSRQGYANISRLFTLANAADRRAPRLDPAHLREHADGVVLLTGGRDGPLAKPTLDGRYGDAQELLADYRAWYGSDAVYVELQQNFLQGDTRRNRELARLADDMHVPVVATNDVHYHAAERCRLQHALVAARRNTTIDRALPFIRPNHHLHLKSPAQMQRLFRERPDAVANTRRIAERCAFNLSSDLGYTLPDPQVPEGYTPEGFLRRLCMEAAQRRYGTVSARVRERLDEEFRLIGKHRLAGFLLLYREIVLLAQRIMEEKGLAPPETPLEERPPGRGRGSSVALLVGYLIGISHVDPLRWDLTLERFISEEMSMLPDIDLDFPRAIRDDLIGRVHEHFGPEFAVLTGAIATYSVKGIIQDLGKALGLPKEDLKLLSRQLHSLDAADLRDEMLSLPAFRDRVAAPGWRDLVTLAPQLMHAPRSLGQHVGGMILSDSPIPEMVPIRAGAMDGRFIMDWNKDSVADANFAKIDLLSLPVLDQIEEALDLIEEREGQRPDLSKLDPEDPGVYDMINEGRSKGIFLLQSPAQLKMGQRLRSRNLLDLAYQVALIRPGVGVQGSAVSQFVDRYRHGVPWDYDHSLEQRALERGYGIIVWQEQVVQLLDGRGGDDRRGGRRGAPRVRPAQQRAPDRHALGAFPRGSGAEPRPRGGREEDIRQGQRALHVPRIALPRLRRHRIPGGVAEALPPGGVLHGADEQSADGLLPGGDAQGGRTSLRRALPEPRREPQRSAVRPLRRCGAAGSSARQGRWGGVPPMLPRAGARGARPLPERSRPRAAHGAEAAGGALAGDGRGLRRRDAQPEGGAVGRRAWHPPREERSAGVRHRRGRGRCTCLRRLLGRGEDDGRVPGDGPLPEGTRHGVRAPTAPPGGAARRRSRDGARGRCGRGGGVAGSAAAPEG